MTGEKVQTPAAAVRAAVHELQGTLGVIRLAVTAIQDDAPPDLRDALLTNTLAAVSTLTTHLAALGPLTAALGEPTRHEAVDLKLSATDAARCVRPVGLDVTVEGANGVSVMADSRRLALLLPSMMVMVAGGEPTASAEVQRDAGHGVLVLHASAGQGPATPPGRTVLFGMLVAALGGALRTDDRGGAVAVSWPEGHW